MLAGFFIKKPVLSFVISFLFMLGGAFCIPLIPVNQYPNVAPETISISTIYTGASSELVESSVIVPLEESLNGLENVRYISSTSSTNGTGKIKVVLESGNNPAEAIFEIQNRIKLVEPRLPKEVIKNGIVVKKTSSALVLVFGLYSEKEVYDRAYLSNYLNRYLLDSLRRVKGVSDISVFGSREYAMRIWLDPYQLAKYKITPQEVIQALKEQNVQTAAGQIGQAPTSQRQRFQSSLKVVGRLKSPAEFENILIKRTENSLVKLKEIARVEIGAEDYSSILRFNENQNVVGVLVNHLPSASAIEVSKLVLEKLNQLSKNFPTGIKYQVAFDTTKSVKDSIQEVVFSLLQAIVLVVLVIYLFLLNARSALIPAITIPISLLSSFLFIKIFGFSINNLTLFGLTLATGVVVDDAIVVVENISMLLERKDISPQQAALKTMQEISGAVIATSLVLLAVFVPIAFFPGSTGKLYNQFALTIGFSIFVSTFNALTFSPAISALILKKPEHKEHKDNKDNKAKIWQIFEEKLQSLNRVYFKLLKKALRARALVLICFLLFLLLTVFLFQVLPRSFVPAEDRGYFIVALETPPDSSLERTSQSMKKIEQILLSEPEIKSLFAIAGFSFFGAGPNRGIMFPALKESKARKSKKQSVQAVIERIRPKLLAVPGVLAIPFAPPSIRGLGSLGGFEFQLKAESGNFTLAELSQISTAIIIKAARDPNLRGVFSAFKVNTPQLELKIDREKARASEIELKQIFTTIQAFFASIYVNDFVLDNKIYKVYLQADRNYRDSPEDLEQVYLRTRSSTGGSEQQALVPLGNFLEIKERLTAQNIKHFNLARSITLNGSAAPGKSLGEAVKALERIARETSPKGINFEWSGIVREQLEAGNKSLLIFLLGLLVVFLVLAAQYESFITPLIIMLAVPLAVFGGLLFQFLRGLNNDLYTQIGLIMLIGLASKNSILMVEFANQIRARGAGILRSIVRASLLRFRAILMTSFSFILGMLPLVFASGPGSASKHSLGTVVWGGMLVSTILTLFLVPSLYLIIMSLEEKFKNLLSKPVLS